MVFKSSGDKEKYISTIVFGNYYDGHYCQIIDDSTSCIFYSDFDHKAIDKIHQFFNKIVSDYPELQDTFTVFESKINYATVRIYNQYLTFDNIFQLKTIYQKL